MRNIALKTALVIASLMVVAIIASKLNATWLVILFVIILSFILIRGRTYHITCPNCKYEGIAKKTVKGSIVTELILWIFILPGMLYSLWRLTTRTVRCPQCGFEYVKKTNRQG